MGRAKASIRIFLCCAVLLKYVSCGAQYEDMDPIGKAAKGRLGSLYHLRNKLRSSVQSSSGSQLEGNGQASTVRRMYGHPQQKESRGYSFHHSSSNIANPVFAGQQGYSPRDFHSRMGKVSDSGRQWKSGGGDKSSMDKYLKYAYKLDNDSGWKDGGNGLNSFNIYQLDSNSSTFDSKNKVTPVPTPSTTTQASTTVVFKKTPAPLSPQFPVAGIDISPIKALGQGINSAMTTALTQKLMGMIDQEVPQGFLNPLKHLVSSGQRMVEFWDKRTNARDGKTPGIVEMFGYGIEQLKRYRDGQAMSPEDPIANLTSASKAMIQGMVVVKKLTNRVLGYDTDEAMVESRGGYDHGGYGWGHHVSYGGIGGLDPFALLAALAFGAFLLQLLLTLLNTSARSLDVVDMNVPLLLSDYHVPNIMTRMDRIFGTPTVRTKRSADGEEDGSTFNSIVDKLEGMYRTYKTMSSNPTCARLYMCRAAIQDPSGNDHTIFSQLYSLGLSQLSGDTASLSFLKSIKSRASKGEDVNCDAEVKGCTE